MKYRCVSILILIFTLAAGCGGSSYDKEQLYTQFEELKQTVHDHTGFEVLPKSMRIIACSILSDGLSRYASIDSSRIPEIQELLGSVAESAFQKEINPYGDPEFYDDLDTDEYNLYLSHLNIILSHYFEVTKNNRYTAIQEKINDYLRRITDSGKNWLIASYPGSRLIFPADLAAMVYSMWLSDKTHAISRDADLPGRLIGFLKSYCINPDFELPFSEINGSIWYSYYPRGCATAFLIYYVHFYGAQESISWWEKHNRAFRETFLDLTVYREWFTGTSDPVYTAGLEKWKENYGAAGDADTGPMIGEYGSAATGLSLLACAAVGDRELYPSIKRAIEKGTVMFEKINPGYRKYTENILTRAILFTADTQ